MLVQMCIMWNNGISTRVSRGVTVRKMDIYLGIPLVLTPILHIIAIKNSNRIQSSNFHILNEVYVFWFIFINLKTFLNKLKR